MSVINNVLKELENKPSVFTPLDLNQVKRQNKKSFSNGLWWGMSTLLLVVMMLVVYLYQQKQNTSALQQEESNMPINPINHAEVSAIPQKSEIEKTDTIVSDVAQLSVKDENEIIGLDINETQQFLELSFQMSGSARAFLKQRTENRHIFLIRNSSSQILTPVINNPWVKRISLQQVESDVEIQFDTAEGVLVETSHQQLDPNYIWSIRLKKTIEAMQPVVFAHKEMPITKVEPQALVSDKENKSEVSQAEEVSEVTEKPPTDNVKLEIKPVIKEPSDFERLTLARNKMKEGEWQAAQSQLKSLIGRKVDKQARVSLLSLYQYQKNKLEFDNLLEQSLNRYPEVIDFMIIDANQLFSSQQYLTLVQRYTNHKSNLSLISLLAGSHQRLGQHEQAAGFYKTALELDPRQPKNWISLAISQEHQSQFKQAVQSYQLAQRSGVMNERLRAFVQQRLKQLKQTAE